jgi:hypothetical protein
MGVFRSGDDEIDWLDDPEGFLLLLEGLEWK